MWCTLHATHAVVLTFFRVIDVHFETDLHLFGLLILLHLLEHRNLSPHAPGDLGNLIADLQLRNLHDFLHRRLCLVTKSVPFAQLGRQQFFQ